MRENDLFPVDFPAEKCRTVAEEANSLKMALQGTKLSSKRTGKDTYFWIINNNETERMLFVF